MYSKVNPFDKVKFNFLFSWCQTERFIQCMTYFKKYFEVNSFHFFTLFLAEFFLLSMSTRTLFTPLLDPLVSSSLPPALTFVIRSVMGETGPPESKPSLKIGSVNKAFLFWYWQRSKKLSFRNKTINCLNELKFCKVSQNSISN